MPDAEVIAIGSELLTPQKLDTNSLYLTDQLNALGVEVVRKTVVGDERERLMDSILGALARSQIIVLTGGLGPTEDDLTRDAVATALGRTLVFRQDLCDLGGRTLLCPGVNRLVDHVAMFITVKVVLQTRIVD